MVEPVDHVLRFLRSLLAGGLATLVDLGVLALLVSGLHLAPRVANGPALLAGAVVAFFGNRHFAFRAGGGRLGRQALLFAIVELVALGLNGVLFDTVLRAVPAATHAYAVVRLVTTNLVYLAFSYPMWRFVFRRPAAEVYREPR